MAIGIEQINSLLHQQVIDKYTADTFNHKLVSIQQLMGRSVEKHHQLIAEDIFGAANNLPLLKQDVLFFKNTPLGENIRDVEFD